MIGLELFPDYQLHFEQFGTCSYESESKTNSRPILFFDFRVFPWGGISMMGLGRKNVDRSWSGGSARKDPKEWKPMLAGSYLLSSLEKSNMTFI